MTKSRSPGRTNLTGSPELLKSFGLKGGTSSGDRVLSSGNSAIDSSDSVDELKDCLDKWYSRRWKRMNVSTSYVIRFWSTPTGIARAGQIEGQGDMTSAR